MSGRHPLLLLPSLLALSLAAGARASAAEEAPLPALLPGGTLGAIVASDLGALGPALRESGMGRLLGEPEILAIWEEVEDRIRPEVANVERALGAPLSALSGLLDAEVCYAITGLSAPRQNPALHHHLALVRPRGDAARAAWTGLLDRLAEAVRATGGVSEGTAKLGGVFVRTLEKDGVTLYHGIHRGIVFLSTDEEGLTTALARASAPKGGAPTGLAAVPAYARTRERVLGGRPGALLFVDTLAVADAVWKHLPSDAQETLDALGAREIEGLGLGVSVDGPALVDVLYVDAPNARKGLFRTIEALGPIGACADALDRLPPETIAAIALRIRPRAAFHLYLELVARFAEASQYGSIDDFLARFHEETGVSAGGLADALGDDVLVYVAAPDHGEGLYPEVVLSWRLKDPAAMQGALDRLVARGRRGGAGLPALDVRDIPTVDGGFRYLNLGRLGGQSIFEPAWCIRGDRLLVALTPIHLKRAIARHAAAEDATRTIGRADAPALERKPSGLATGAEALRACAGARPAATRLLLAVDSSKLVRSLYNTYGPFFQAAGDKGDIPFEPGLLPTADTLTRHLPPAALALERDQAGVTLSLRGPASALSTLAFLAGADASKKLARKGAGMMAMEGAPLETEEPVVSFAFDAMGLADALDEIARASGVAINYPRERIASRRVSATGERVPVLAAVEDLLEGTGLAARLREAPDGTRAIAVYPAPAVPYRGGARGEEGAGR